MWESGGGGEGGRVSWRQSVPSPPLKAQRLTFNQIIQRIPNLTKSFAYYNPKQANDPTLL